MPFFSSEDITFFCENGYIILENMLTPLQIEAAQDALWNHIEADRNDTSTWINAGPRGPDCPDDPALRATLFDTPLFGMCKELAGDLENDVEQRIAKFKKNQKIGSGHLADSNSYVLQGAA